jgi:hypothetical protein
LIVPKGSGLGTGGGWSPKMVCKNGQQMGWRCKMVSSFEEV